MRTCPRRSAPFPLPLPPTLPQPSRAHLPHSAAIADNRLPWGTPFARSAGPRVALPARRHSLRRHRLTRLPLSRQKLNRRRSLRLSSLSWRSWPSSSGWSPSTLTTLSPRGRISRRCTTSIARLGAKVAMTEAISLSTLIPLIVRRIEAFISLKRIRQLRASTRLLALTSRFTREWNELTLWGHAERDWQRREGELELPSHLWSRGHVLARQRITTYLGPRKFSLTYL